ncbi:SANT/Myb-like DNA-binding domain-containing protein [Bradyrhizobium barranii subsp. apii]|uniref:SANT/Myb-like DNA-binding domain-containing protein n=1 Tax=Bradyrhizobium barranii TaxID=2992140 RepID=UPI001AA1719F|nr:SANT/Myb-like DNA-binding domain-containing protein [Bradyrhizobium barranii]UPT93919.1 SANT/Myb-like DNA-binding domain-containing protein [Bradyrhizobium barranii subsp. apii]
MSWPVRGDRWSAEELAKLCDVVERYGAEWKNVAAQMPGRSVEACKQAYNTHERQRRLAEAAPSVAASPKRLKSWQDKRAREKAADQERATAFAQERTRTSKFFGDPLPGRSALDKKRAGIADPDYFDRRVMHVPKKPTLYTGGAA